MNALHSVQLRRKGRRPHGQRLGSLLFLSSFRNSRKWLTLRFARPRGLALGRLRAALGASAVVAGALGPAVVVRAAGARAGAKGVVSIEVLG